MAINLCSGDSSDRGAGTTTQQAARHGECPARATEKTRSVHTKYLFQCRPESISDYSHIGQTISLITIISISWIFKFPCFVFSRRRSQFLAPTRASLVTSGPQCSARDGSRAGETPHRRERCGRRSGGASSRQLTAQQVDYLDWHLCDVSVYTNYYMVELLLCCISNLNYYK